MSPLSPADSEWQTRRKLINPKLEAAGWRIVPFQPHKPFAAYDRCAIVEAKKLTLGPQNVLTQAERCSAGLIQKKQKPRQP